MNLPAGNVAEYVGTLTGQRVSVEGGRINVCVGANSGEIWVPAGDLEEYQPFKAEFSVKEETKETEAVEEAPVAETASEDKKAIAEEAAATQKEVKNEEATETPEVPAEKEPVKVDPNKSPEDMTVEELQAAILAKMANNGPVTDQMKKTVYDNIWHDSLVNWLKSFR